MKYQQAKWNSVTYRNPVLTRSSSDWKKPENNHAFVSEQRIIEMRYEPNAQQKIEGMRSIVQRITNVSPS